MLTRRPPLMAIFPFPATSELWSLAPLGQRRRKGQSGHMLNSTVRFPGDCMTYCKWSRPVFIRRLDCTLRHTPQCDDGNELPPRPHHQHKGSSHHTLVYRHIGTEEIWKFNRHSPITSLASTSSKYRQTAKVAALWALTYMSMLGGTETLSPLGIM